MIIYDSNNEHKNLQCKKLKRKYKYKKIKKIETIINDQYLSLKNNIEKSNLNKKNDLNYKSRSVSK